MNLEGLGCLIFVLVVLVCVSFAAFVRMHI
jgi:hypothetical protein